jgi:hypothetical protein
VKYNPQSYKQIFGTDFRRQYSSKIPDLTLPDYPWEYDDELQYAARLWAAFHPWDKEFRSRLWKVEETGDARDRTYVQQLQYEHWMNICRRMQAVIDKDGGKGSPVTLVGALATYARQIAKFSHPHSLECSHDLLPLG